MNVKKIITMFAICLLLLSVPLSANAHTVSSTGSENLGYIIGTHTPTKTPLFFWVAGTEQKWKDRFNGGNTYMHNETSYNLKAVNATVWDTSNYVEAYANNLSTFVAAVYTDKSSGQHKDIWHLSFNPRYDTNYTEAQWKRIAQHELGHVFGLKDLYETSNSSLLMYGYAGSYSGLKTKDLNGLKLIWGF